MFHNLNKTNMTSINIKKLTQELLQLCDNLYFIITRFETKNEPNLNQVDETKLYYNFNQTLNNIPIIIDNSNLYTFKEFLSKCDYILYKKFYDECFDSDCYDGNAYYLKHQKHFSNLLKQNLKQK